MARIPRPFDSVQSIPEPLQAMDDTHVPEKDFVTDGCSGGMSWFWHTILRRPPPWEGACIAHDYAYWFGGTKAERLAADIRLAGRITLKGYPLTATFVFYAVRVFGNPHWSFPFRWNYGSGEKKYRELERNSK